MIDAAAKEIGFPAEIIADRVQRLTNSQPYNFAMGTLYGLSYPKEPKLSELPLTEQIYVAQKKAIEDMGKGVTEECYQKRNSFKEKFKEFFN